MVKPQAPTDADRAEVTKLALVGIGGGAQLDDAFLQFRAFAGYAFPFPADVLIELAADALGIAGAKRADPVSLRDMYERFLPEWDVSGNTAHQKSRAAVQTAIALHGGIVAEYDTVAGWWQVNDFALYAFQTCVIMIRVAADRTGTPVSRVCAELAAQRDLPL